MLLSDLRFYTVFYMLLHLKGFCVATTFTCFLKKQFSSRFSFGAVAFYGVIGSISLNVFANSISTANLTSPANNAIVTSRPCFKWNSVSGADYYTVQVSSDTNFNQYSKRYILRDITATSACWSTQFIANPTAGFTPSQMPERQMFYWRIKAMQSGGATTFSQIRSFKINGNPSVSITSPKQGQIVSSNHPDVDLVVRANASDQENKIKRVEFRLNSGSFRSDTSAPYSYNFGSSIPVGVNRVCARSVDELSLYSNLQCKTFYGIGKAVAQSPMSNEEGNKTPVFEWAAAQYATTYTVQVSSDTNFNEHSKRWVLRDIPSARTTAQWSSAFIANPTAGFTPESLDAGETYFWRVKSVNEGGAISFSDYVSFEVPVIEVTQKFYYDALGRLIRVVEEDKENEAKQYYYDDAGNRTEVIN